MDKNTQKVMFSSNSDEWTTPKDFFDILDNIYHFTLDPATNGTNGLCSKFFTSQNNGLSQSWEGERSFVNPPYSKIKDWVKKSFEEGQKPDTLVVMLIPARTDTRYWHEYVMKAQEVFLVKGRLKFGGRKTGAPFPSAVVVFWKDMPFKPSSIQFHSMNRS